MLSRRLPDRAHVSLWPLTRAVKQKSGPHISFPGTNGYLPGNFPGLTALPLLLDDRDPAEGT
jgi:hypothetical protein